MNPKKLVNKTLNIELAGTDGNAFALLGAFRRQAKRERWTEEEIHQVLEEAKSKDYAHLLQTLTAHTLDGSPPQDL
jgi:hypothetical protein